MSICRKCNHPHINEEQNMANVCKSTNPMCMCIDFQPTIEGYPMLNDIDRYMMQFDKVLDKMKWVLENIQFFRNYNNQELVFAWWQYINHWNPKWQPLTIEIYRRLDPAETITRSRRHWRELDEDKFGPLSRVIAEQQRFKQWAIEECLISRK